MQFEEVGETEEAVQSVYFEKMLQSAQRQHGFGGLPGQAEAVSCPAALGNENDDVSGHALSSSHAPLHALLSSHAPLHDLKLARFSHRFG